MLDFSQFPTIEMQHMRNCTLIELKSLSTLKSSTNEVGSQDPRVSNYVHFKSHINFCILKHIIISITIDTKRTVGCVVGSFWPQDSICSAKGMVNMCWK